MQFLTLENFTYYIYCMSKIESEDTLDTMCHFKISTARGNHGPPMITSHDVHRHTLLLARHWLFRKSECM